MPGELKPCHLLAGDDEGKIDAALARLRARAEREGGVAALESFTALDGTGPPDVDALIRAMGEMSLLASRRYLVADRVDRLDAKRLGVLSEALASLPPETTVVLVDRAGRSRATAGRAKAMAALRDAVEKAGGEVHVFGAPSARELPGRLVAAARERGFELEAAAARILIDRLGDGTLRLMTELDRLALWAEPGGAVTAEDLEAMVADTSEEAAWTLSDALVARDSGAAVKAAERLLAQGESVTGLVYQAAKRLREAHGAVSALESGSSQKEVERSLRMHPYAAKMLMRKLGLLGRDGPLAGRRARPRDRRASYFGVSGAMSAFTIAFQVPNLMRALFADAALPGAFVPSSPSCSSRASARRRSSSPRAVGLITDRARRAHARSSSCSRR
jgi:DNA polymerase III delta subunit